MLSGLRPGDAYCDLGSGDGRLLRAAGGGVGYELNAELVRKSREVTSAEIRRQDFMEADWSEFSYITYQGEWSDLIRSKFHAEARPGARLQIYGEALCVQP